MPRVFWRVLTRNSGSRVRVRARSCCCGWPTGEAGLRGAVEQAARLFFEDLDHPVVGRQSIASLPFRMTGVDRWLHTPAPTPVSRYRLAVVRMVSHGHPLAADPTDEQALQERIALSGRPVPAIDHGQPIGELT